MAECDEIFKRISTRAAEKILRIPDECQKTLDWLESYKKEILSKIAQAKTEKSKVAVLSKTPARNRRPKRRAVSSSTDEDNNSSKSENPSTNITDSSVCSAGKPKRNASKLAAQNINKQSQIKLNSKMRRPGKEDTVLNDISNNSIRLNIKAEKKSQSPSKEPAPEIVLNPEPENVKKEIMPPPAAKPKRGRKKIKKEVESSDTENEAAGTRITRSKRTVSKSSSTLSTKTASSTRTTSKTRKDSDVILQETPVQVVEIHDSDTEDALSQVNSEVENNNEDSKQVTDTPVESDEDDRPLKPRKPAKKTKKQIEAKTKKTNKTKVEETDDDTLYEDALPTVNKDNEVAKDKAKQAAKNINCTVTLEKITLNDTHIVQKEAKMSHLNIPDDVQKNARNSALNATHVIEKETKISPLNTTHIIQKEVKVSPLNTTHVVQKDVQISSLNTTHVIEKTVSTSNGTKDNDSALKINNKVTQDCTVVLQKMNVIANQTVVLTPKENGHHWKKADIPLPVDNLITDDDDSIVKATPEKKPEPPRKGTKTKQMFSPYANSPVRKRVAAFEKLVLSDPVDAPTRVTRTKTRNMEKEKENLNNFESSRIPTTKSRYVTPSANNKLPSLIPQSDSKAYRQGTTGNKNTSVLPTKSASAIKPSRAEMQLRREEEQKKRLEKEDDAKRKREALMQAKAEEQRKKREEKQLKAQKAREEMEREKEEKLRQIMQEKEEEQQKKREWQAKKQMEYEERKKNEEMIKLLKQREQEKQKQQEEKRRRQFATKPPPLPTDDCEDSDSSTDTVPKKYHKPDWAQSQNLCRSLIIWKYISKARIVSLWQMEATTPDLQEIFETVDERILRRNSSAVWRTPPRYSTLPKF